MTRETKLGLMMVTLLVGVFGFLVYKKLHQQTVAVAGVMDNASTAEATTDLNPLEAPAEFGDLADSGAPANDDPFAAPDTAAAPAATTGNGAIASRISSRPTSVPTRQTAASQIADRIEEEPFEAPSQPAAASLESSAPQTATSEFAADLSTESSSSLQAPASNSTDADPFAELAASGTPVAPTPEPRRDFANASAGADTNSTASSFGAGNEGDAADPFANFDEPATTSSAASTVPSSAANSPQLPTGAAASSNDQFTADEFASTAPQAAPNDEFLPPTSAGQTNQGADLTASSEVSEPAGNPAALGQTGTEEQDPFALEDDAATAVEPAVSGTARSVTRPEVAPAQNSFGTEVADEFSAPVVTTQPAPGMAAPQHQATNSTSSAPTERLGEFDVVDLNQIRPATARPSTTAGGSTVIAAFPTRGGTYTVRPSDTFWSISRQIYGTGKYFQALARHNAGIIADPQKMKPGVQIATPPATLLEEQYAALIPATPVKANVANAIARTGGATAPTRAPELEGFFLSEQGQPMYRVADQDTLSSIALSHLGRSSRWVQILELNREILKDGNTLTIGTVLKLPADASQVRVVSGER